MSRTSEGNYFAELNKHVQFMALSKIGECNTYKVIEI